MDHLNYRYFSLTKKCMRLTGLWPYENPVVLFLKRLFFLFTHILGILGQVNNLQKISVNYDRYFLLFSLYSMTFWSGLLVKYIYTILAANKIIKIFQNIDKNWRIFKDVDEIEELIKCSEYGRRITLFYTVSMYSAIFVGLPLLLLPKLLDNFYPLANNASRSTIFLIGGHYYLFDEEVHYYYSFFIEAVMCIAIVPVMTGAESIYVNCVHHCLGLISVLRLRLRMATKFENRIQNSANREMVHNKMVEAVKLHRLIIGYFEDLQDVYYTFFFFGVTLFSIVVAGTGINVALANKNNLYELIKFIIVYVGIYLHLFFLWWHGQMLIDESTKIFHEMYNNEWYKCSIKVKKMVLYMMMRSKNPIKLRAGGICTIDFKFFGWLIKTTLSYITIVASLGRDK